MYIMSRFKNEDYYGTYMFGKPVLNVNNPDLIKEILVKDFNKFVDRNDTNMLKALGMKWEWPRNWYLKLFQW